MFWNLASLSIVGEIIGTGLSFSVSGHRCGSSAYAVVLFSERSERANRFRFALSPLPEFSLGFDPSIGDSPSPLARLEVVAVPGLFLRPGR